MKHCWITTGEKQGQFVDGVKVESPDVLVDMNPDDYKVFLCIKQFSTVLRQLLDAGVKNYGIYNQILNDLP